jgi:hypothetical protein
MDATVSFCGISSEYTAMNTRAQSVRLTPGSDLQQSDVKSSCGRDERGPICSGSWRHAGTHPAEVDSKKLTVRCQTLMSCSGTVAESGTEGRRCERCARAGACQYSRSLTHGTSRGVELGILGRDAMPGRSHASHPLFQRSQHQGRWSSSGASGTSAQWRPMMVRHLIECTDRMASVPV